MRRVRQTPGKAFAILLALPLPAAAMALPGLEGGRTQYLPMVVQEATAQAIPPELADAVAMVETGYRPDVIGSSGEVGLMQIMPATARQLGFRGTTAELAAPATNIALGVRYLARAWALGGGDVCRSLMKYRAGLGQEVMTPLSAAYCTRAIAWLGSTGSRLARSATLPDGAAAPPPAADPYVIAIVPALAAQALLHPVMATARQPVGPYRPHRLMADQQAADNARFAAHQRRLSPASLASVQAAIEAAQDQ